MSAADPTPAIPPPPRRWIILVGDHETPWELSAAKGPYFTTVRQDADDAAGIMGGRVVDYDLWLRGAP